MFAGSASWSVRQSIYEAFRCWVCRLIARNTLVRTCVLTLGVSTVSVLEAAHSVSLPPSTASSIMSDHAADHTEGDTHTEWNDAANSSVDPAQRAQIKTFCSVTGADADSALHVLEAHNWDMDRSVMFFLEGGVSAPRQNIPALAAPSAGYQAAAAPTDFIDLDADAHVPAEQTHHPAEAVSSAPPNDHEVRL